MLFGKSVAFQNSERILRIGSVVSEPLGYNNKMFPLYYSSIKDNFKTYTSSAAKLYQLRSHVKVTLQNRPQYFKRQIVIKGH